MSRIKKMFKNMNNNIVYEYKDSTTRLKQNGALSSEKAWTLNKSRMKKVDEVVSSESSRSSYNAYKDLPTNSKCN